MNACATILYGRAICRYVADGSGSCTDLLNAFRYATVPVDNLHRVPDNVTDQEACFTEPLAAACRIVEQKVSSGCYQAPKERKKSSQHSGYRTSFRKQ